MEREIVCLDTSILIDYFRKKSKEENDIWQANFEKDRKCAYLINTNSNSIFKYTIKTTEASSPPSSTTKIYELYPGEEIYIDCDKYVEYERNIITRSFKVVGEIKSK